MHCFRVAQFILSLLPAATSAVAQVDPNIGHAYARYLSDLHEPDLRTSTDTAEVYRALWIRSFHEPVSVRLFRTADTFVVITAQGTRHDSATFRAEVWNTLHLRNAMKRFWTTRPTPLPRGVVGVDGAQWILEGRHGPQYHAVAWWSPQEREVHGEGGYRRLFLEILSIGTVCVSPDAVY